jgi:hypothetical protein
MRTLISAMIVLTALAGFGCSSTSGNGSGAGTVQGAKSSGTGEPLDWGIPGPAPRQPAATAAGDTSRNQWNQWDTGAANPATARSNGSNGRSPASNGSRSNASNGSRSNGSNGSHSNASKSNAARSHMARSTPAAPEKPLPKDPNVSILKIDDAEVPAAVRAIETVIDKRSALLADVVRIEVSKNYEWDVSLSGNGVTPHRPDQGGTVAEASGNPRAYFRNLDIRAREKIVLWRSGMNVTPFIRIYASGGVSYIDTDDATGKPRVKRAASCKINNSSIKFDEQILGVPGMDAAAAQPTALHEKTK